jgi:hypothetical protein
MTLDDLCAPDFVFMNVCYGSKQSTGTVLLNYGLLHLKKPLQNPSGMLTRTNSCINGRTSLNSVHCHLLTFWHQQPANQSPYRNLNWTIGSSFFLTSDWVPPLKDVGRQSLDEASHSFLHEYLEPRKTVTGKPPWFLHAWPTRSIKTDSCHGLEYPLKFLACLFHRGRVFLSQTFSKTLSATRPGWASMFREILLGECHSWYGQSTNDPGSGNAWPSLSNF